MNRSTLGAFALGIFGMLAFACGGDDNNSGGGTKADFVKQCKRACDKEVSCGEEQDCSLCDEIPEAALRCNYAEMKAKTDECMRMECSDVVACNAEVIELCPELIGGSSGTGGSNSGGSSSSGGRASGGSSNTGGGVSPGTGGRASGGNSNTGGGVAPGTGGGSSGGDCSVCARAEPCCVAFYEEYPDPETDPADCEGMAQTCEDLGDQKDLIISSCQAILDGGAGLGIGACK